MILFVTVITLFIIYYIYEELIYITFDEDGANITNIKVNLLNYIFALLMGLSIAVSIRITGVLVISSMIVLPVASAMQYKKGFSKTLMISIIIALIDIIFGLILSFYLDSAPGGTIALISVFTMLISLAINKNKL